MTAAESMARAGRHRLAMHGRDVLAADPATKTPGAAGVWARELDDGTPVLLAERHQRPLTFNAARARPPIKGDRGAGAWRVQKEIESWRKWARDEAGDRLVPSLPGPLVVDIYHLRVNRGALPDVGAPILAVKALLDGLVDAGVLPDGDGPDVVTRLTFHTPLIAGTDGLRVRLTSIPRAVEQTALDLTEGNTSP